MKLGKVHIPRRSRTCCVGGSTFSPGTTIFSALFDGKTALERRDACEKCLKEEDRGDWQENSLCFWSVQIPKLDELPRGSRAEQKRTLALQELRKSLDEGKNGEAFVLALYLMRSKVAVQRRLKKKGLFIEILATGDILQVPDPNMESIPVEELQASLASKLTLPSEKEEEVSTA